MNIMPAHSQFGGSVAARILGCPGSVQQIMQVPASLRKPSSAYADRGTALHTAMSRLIEGECALDDLAGTTIDEYTLTHDDVEDALKERGYDVVVLQPRKADNRRKLGVRVSTMDSSINNCYDEFGWFLGLME